MILQYYNQLMEDIAAAIAGDYEELTPEERSERVEDHLAIRKILWKYLDQEDKDSLELLDD